MAQIIVEGASRATRGKNEARRLRVSGKVPATLYGGKGDVLALAVNTKQVTAILRSESGHNTLFQVNLGGSLSFSAPGAGSQFSSSSGTAGTSTGTSTTATATTSGSDCTSDYSEL